MAGRVQYHLSLWLLICPYIGVPISKSMGKPIHGHIKAKEAHVLVSPLFVKNVTFPHKIICRHPCFHAHSILLHDWPNYFSLRYLKKYEQFETWNIFLNKGIINFWDILELSSSAYLMTYFNTSSFWPFECSFFLLP